MRLPVVLVVVASLAVSGGLLWWSTSSNPPADTTGTTQAGDSGTAGGQGAQTQASGLSASAVGTLDNSAPGAASYSQIARMFEIGFAGGVVVSEDTRATIETALAALSNPPTDAELREFERVLTATLPYADVQKVLALTKGYAGYANELKGEIEQHGLPQNLAEFDASMARVTAIRLRHFDPATAEALFGPHDAYARITVEATFVDADPNLSPEQKRRRLAELRDKLPESQKALLPPPEAPSSQAGG